MSLTFDPDSNAAPNGTWDTTYLSDRDVSAQVPINFVPHPGVYVTAACFGNNVYNSTYAENCLSNLLISQVRRYIIDVYWDSLNEVFSLCPVQIPASPNNASQIGTSEGPVVVNSALNSASLTPRQATTTFASNASSTQSSTTTSAPSTYSVISSNGAAQYLQLGPYRCSNTLTLASLTSVFADYLADTANTLDAKIVVWILNLHLATPLDQLTDSPSSNSSATNTAISDSSEPFPRADQSISSYLDNIDNVLYKPGQLLDDRKNLNVSWFSRQAESELPLVSYYNLFSTSSGDLATDDGWPNEDYIQVVDGKRMLVGFGTIDESMSSYNTSDDGNRVYPPMYLSSTVEYTFDSNGELSSGCFYEDEEFTVNERNNSWAMATINQISPPDLGDLADNLTTCGISQMLNVTIGGVTADVEADPYQNFGNNAVFGWAFGQPINDSSIDTTEAKKFRCALMVSTVELRGHWVVDFCSEGYHVACREGNSPYRWKISEYQVAYGSGDAACRGNSTFDVPRTGLENRYLYNKILEDAEEYPELLEGVWINFNSLDTEDCWVTTGVNGSCPYYQNQSATSSRQILIPTIAALIVLILSVLTVLIKCSTNARNSKKSRRGDGGWDYEGVPS